MLTKNFNTLLHQRIIQLERSTVNNAQYHGRESLEVNLITRDIGDNVLEETLCRAISLTGHEVTPDDLHECYRLKNKYRVISKLRDRKLKHSIRTNRNVLQSKSLELYKLKFSGKLFICESVTVYIIFVLYFSLISFLLVFSIYLFCLTFLVHSSLLCISFSL